MIKTFVSKVNLIARSANRKKMKPRMHVPILPQIGNMFFLKSNMVLWKTKSIIIFLQTFSWKCKSIYVNWLFLEILILNGINLACIHHTGKCQIKQARTAITGEMGKLPNWLQWIWNRFFNSHFRTTIAAAGVKGFVLFWKTFSCVLRPSIGTATAK